MRNSNSRSRFANSEPAAKTSPQNSEKKQIQQRKPTKQTEQLKKPQLQTRLNYS